MWWIVVLCIVIAATLLILLLSAPLGLSALYNDSGARIRLVVGVFRLQVFPWNKKWSRIFQSRERKEPSKPKKEKKPKEEKEETKGGSISDFYPFVQAFLDIVQDFRKKVRVNRLELKIVLAEDDPADLAMHYGMAWAAIGNLWPRLERIFVIQKRNVEVECDFEGTETTVYARVDISVTVGRMIVFGFSCLVRTVKELITFLKKRNGGK